MRRLGASDSAPLDQGRSKCQGSGKDRDNPLVFECCRTCRQVRSHQMNSWLEAWRVDFQAPKSQAPQCLNVCTPVFSFFEICKAKQFWLCENATMLESELSRYTFVQRYLRHIPSIEKMLCLLVSSRCPCVQM